ncbi:hypothetical protein CLV25_1252 [Acetobacteroides hydrogenigenes]|uniref:Uncharacterized protein n=2 Tax=Acetobacteroides hydrogenigenes TaxID=979970 RepID=A0A4R2ECH9_9BACT|nr:hypothetical protein CLV25_1252 [Acetobacteroides hydrogenigenes]
MPAFALVYLLNNEQDKLKVDVVNFIANAYTAYTCLGGLALLKDAKAIQKVTILLKFFKESACAVLDQKKIKKKLEKKYPDLMRNFEIIKGVELTASTVFSITNAEWFTSIYNTWNVIARDKEIATELGDDNIKKITSSLNNLKAFYGDDNTVY